MAAVTLPFDDFLSLTRLYARFDEIAKGRVPGNSSAAHQSVLNRLASNRRHAEARGWTCCGLERIGGGGRVLLRGVPPAGAGRQVVPDRIPGPPRALESGPATSRVTTPASLPNAEPVRARYDLLEAAIRGRLRTSWPELSASRPAGVPDRGSPARPDASHPPRPMPVPPHRRSIFGIDVEWASEARWLDDGGR